jgi:hypothetical protein
MRVSVALGRQLNGWGHEFRTYGVHDRFRNDPIDFSHSGRVNTPLGEARDRGELARPPGAQKAALRRLWGRRLMRRRGAAARRSSTGVRCRPPKREGRSGNPAGRSDLAVLANCYFRRFLLAWHDHALGGAQFQVQNDVDDRRHPLSLFAVGQHRHDLRGGAGARSPRRGARSPGARWPARSDLDGTPVFMASSAFNLRYELERRPKIEFTNVKDYQKSVA